jgi:hypothetical protein
MVYTTIINVHNSFRNADALWSSLLSIVMGKWGVRPYVALVTWMQPSSTSLHLKEAGRDLEEVHRVARENRLLVVMQWKKVLLVGM